MSNVRSEIKGIKQHHMQHSYIEIIRENLLSIKIDVKNNTVVLNEYEICLQKM